MSPLLAPVLAQVLTMHVGDRTEARYVHYDQDVYEASTYPVVALDLQVKRANFDLHYAPSITVTPLDDPHRTWLVYHQVGVSAGYNWSRNSLTLSNDIGFGKVNFRLGTLRNEPIAPPADGTDGATPPPTPAAPGPKPPDLTDPANGLLDVQDQNVDYYNAHTLLSASRQMSRELSLSAHLGHIQAGSLGDDPHKQYPVDRAWFAGVSATYTYLLTHRDAFLTYGSLQQSWSQTTGSTALVAMLNEAWHHTFDKRTSTNLGFGISATRFTEESGLEGISIYPTFQAGIVHQVPLAGGQLSFSLNAYSAPSLDPLRAIVDPRVGVGGSIRYSRKRMYMGVDGSLALSVAPSDHDTGAISSAQAQASVGYRLTDFATIDGGWRYTRQNIEGNAEIPSSWAAFIGVGIAYDAHLLGRQGGQQGAAAAAAAGAP